MENRDLKGVYCILNKINGMQYIGGTKTSFKKRMASHRNSLIRGDHKNEYLQKAWNEYCENSFEFKILEIVDDCNSVLEREQFWINCFDFNELYNINKLVTGSNQFSRESIDKRAKTTKMKYLPIVERYESWKVGDTKDCDLTQDELSLFRNWSTPPWNKGLKYESTEHLKVPKKFKGDRSKDRETKRNKLPEIEVYSLEGVLLNTFRSSKDLEEWSTTELNDLPIVSRFSTPRMGKPVKLLQSVNVNKSCKTGRPYKNLIFKFKTKAPINSDVD